METAQILEAFTRKADGKILEVDRTQIFPQAPPGSPQAEVYRPQAEGRDLPGRDRRRHGGLYIQADHRPVL